MVLSLNALSSENPGGKKRLTGQKRPRLETQQVAPVGRRALREQEQRRRPEDRRVRRRRGVPSPASPPPPPAGLGRGRHSISDRGGDPAHPRRLLAPVDEEAPDLPRDDADERQVLCRGPRDERGERRGKLRRRRRGRGRGRGGRGARIPRARALGGGPVGRRCHVHEDVDPAAVVGDDGARGELSRRRRRRGRALCCRRPPRAAPLSSPPVAVAVNPASSSTASSSSIGPIPLLFNRRSQRVVRGQLVAPNVLEPHADKAEAKQREPRAAAAEGGHDTRAALLVTEEERGEAVWFAVFRFGREVRGWMRGEQKSGTRGNF